MNIDEELEATRKKLQETVTAMNQLDQQKQELLQEILRLDGEVRALARIKKQTDGDKEK